MLYRLSVVNKRDISTLQHNVHKVNSRHMIQSNDIVSGVLIPRMQITASGFVESCSSSLSNCCTCLSRAQLINANNHTSKSPALQVNQLLNILGYQLTSLTLSASLSWMLCYCYMTTVYVPSDSNSEN